MREFHRSRMVQWKENEANCRPVKLETGIVWVELVIIVASWRGSKGSEPAGASRVRLRTTYETWRLSKRHRKWSPWAVPHRRRHRSVFHTCIPLPENQRAPGDVPSTNELIETGVLNSSEGTHREAPKFGQPQAHRAHFPQRANFNPPHRAIQTPALPPLIAFSMNRTLAQSWWDLTPMREMLEFGRPSCGHFKTWWRKGT